MTNEGRKRNVPHLLQEQQTLVCLCQCRKRSRAKSSTAFHLVNCFQEGMPEFDSPMGQCFSRFLTVLQRTRGEWKKKKEGMGLDKKNKSK